MSKLYNTNVLVPADKEASNIITVCHKYYIEVLHNEKSIFNMFQLLDLAEHLIVIDHLNVTTQLKAVSVNFKFLAS